MDGIKLNYSVRTLNNELLLPAGAELCADAVKQVVASGRGKSYRGVYILSAGTIRQDLRDCLSQGPYRVIFDTEAKIQDLFAFLKGIRTVTPSVDALEFFKENDPYTYLHIIKVFALSILLTRALRPDVADLQSEVAAGPLHDIGKICVPMSILQKSEPLTRTERGVLEHHTLAGYVLLNHFLEEPDNFLSHVALKHHERRDGSGYPLGISLKDELIEIIVAADIYDALISPRPYRRSSYDNRTALEEITRMAAAGKLSWRVVQALVAQNRASKPPVDGVVVSQETRGAPPAGNNYGVVAKGEEEERTPAGGRSLPRAPLTGPAI